MKLKPSLGAAIGLAMGFALIAILALVPRGPTFPFSDSEPEEPEDRCASIPYDALAHVDTMPVLFPDHELANQSNVEDIRACPYPEIRIHFSSGIDLLLDYTEEWTNAEAVWHSLESAEPDWRSVGTVRGVPALLSDPAKSSETVGGAEFAEGNLLVNLTGNGQIPLDQLVAVAESLGPPEPSATVTAGP